MPTLIRFLKEKVAFKALIGRRKPPSITTRRAHHSPSPAETGKNGQSMGKAGEKPAFRGEKTTLPQIRRAIP
jgi:hypothetical protein